LPDPGFGGTIAAVSTQPEFVTLPETTVVGLRVESTFQELFQQVPAAWRSAFAREGEFDAGLGARLDVGFCDCSLGAKDGVYTEIIGVRTTADAAVPAGMQKVTLPEARYATLEHHGPLAGIAAAFGTLESWIAAQPPSPDGRRWVHDGVKLDIGYMPDGSETAEGGAGHTLYVRVRLAE